MDLSSLLDLVYPPERHRLQRMIRDWERRGRDAAESTRELARIHAEIAASTERRSHRESTHYELEFDPELPITAHRNELRDLIIQHQTIVVCGETGSGKSTQLPKIAMEAGFGVHAMIGHTQPRRLAARSIAKRLREEIAEEAVGFKIRFADATSQSTRVKLMTDGVLLAELAHDRQLRAYDCLIIDEAHERSLNIDLLLAYVRQLLPKRPELRLIITSATIDAEKFAQHFSDESTTVPIVQVSGRTYPVELVYMEATSGDRQEISKEDLPSDRLAHAVDYLMDRMRGDILAFFASERDIRDASKLLKGHLTRHGLAQQIDLVPLYSRLTEEEQQKIFQPHKKRRIVLATNVAESSLTVPGILSVIDTGTARISRYAPKSKVQRLPIEPISQASANQRAGRCGRLAPGICIRLYDESDFNSRPPFTTPEIRRTDLAAAILQVESLSIGAIETLPWLDPPRPEMIRDGIGTLLEIGAIDEQSKLTSLGKKISRWPIGPRVGRMLIEASDNDCLADVLIIAAALESQDPRLRPPEQAAAADAAHQKFSDPRSDFISYLRIWDFYHRLKEDLGRSRLEKACRENFLSPHRIREWMDIHRQLVAMLQSLGLKQSSRKLFPSDLKNEDEQSRETQDSTSFELFKRRETSYDNVHRSLLAGMLSGISMLDDQKRYRGAGNIELSVWPGSGLRRSKSKWIMAAEVVETTARYARSCAMIDPIWIESLAAHLMKHHYEQPHFSKKNGSAMIYRRSTLYGLPIVSRRPVPLSPLDPHQARTMLIDHGLVDGELISRAQFVAHNRRVLEEAETWAAKTRSRDWVVDRFFLQAFYEKNLPEQVVDRISLEKWDRDSDTKCVRLSMDQLAKSFDFEQAKEDFPANYPVGVAEVPLKYRFEPGSDDDGVTITVPQVAVTQLTDDQLDWSIPGLLEPRIVQLIKSLPKNLRRSLVPASDVATKILPELRQRQTQGAPFWGTFCNTLSKHAGETVRKSDFDLSKLDPHLRIRIEVINQQGEIELATREISELSKVDIPSLKTASPAIDQAQFEWTRDKMVDFDIDRLPEKVVVKQASLNIERFPAIIDKDAFAATALFDYASVAATAHQAGITRLWAMIENRELKSQVKHLPGLKEATIWFSNRFSMDQFHSILQDLIAKIAFIEQREPLRSRSDFEAARKDRIARISMASAEVGKWLPKLSEAYRGVRNATGELPKPWKPLEESLLRQIDALFRKNFQLYTSWNWLKELPRYLQAIVARVAKARSTSLSADQTIQRSIDRFEAVVDERCSPEMFRRYPELTYYTEYGIWPISQLGEFRWMIEELRVSLYAQQLGTKVSVSIKRMEKVLAELDGI